MKKTNINNNDNTNFGYHSTLDLRILFSSQMSDLIESLFELLD
jgi:hypothetical protein